MAFYVAQFSQHFSPTDSTSLDNEIVILRSAILKEQKFKPSWNFPKSPSLGNAESVIH